LDEHEHENETITDAIITVMGICDSAEHFNDMDSAVRDNNNQRVYTNSTKQQHRLENKLEHML
jgi:2C-methyl-D-erythritol 2,4-cyclodiphosphate synthase